jgi:hypothetical protein
VSVAVTARRTLARHPWLYWFGCLAAGVALALLVGGHVTRLDEARRSWAQTGRVLVATTDHRAGDLLQAKSVEMPLAVIPPDAIDTVGAASDDGTIVRQRVSTGEVVVSADLAVPGGPAALADPGTLVVGITDPMARGVRVGLEVRIVAEGIVLADDAHVVEVSDEVIFVAVGAEAAAMVAAAARDTSASLVFVP